MKIKSLLSILLFVPIVALAADDPNAPEHLQKTRIMLDGSGHQIGKFGPGQPVSPDLKGICVERPCPIEMSKDKPSGGCWSCIGKKG